MNSTAAPSNADAPDAPIRNFSDCHAGIVTHLDSLAELPDLLEPAARARRIAAEMLKFFRETVYEHHAEEERELFPAVLSSAHKGEERDRVLALVQHLVREHRAIESVWRSLEGGLHDVAKGHDAKLDVAALQRLVTEYKAHAEHEEREFLPMSQEILSRNGRDMAALGVSLHMRHALPQLLSRGRSFYI